MRLICGYLRLDGVAASESLLRGMADAMTAPNLAPKVSHRLDGPLGLATIDFDGHGGAPVELNGWMIAADLRLDQVTDNPESALLDMVERHGPDFPDRLNGDFAVALWRRETQELWLGRDFIGVRPLAWTWRPGRWFAFASLPKGLHKAGFAAAMIDPVALGTQITQTYFTGADTGFAEIANLCAGHSLVVRPHDNAPPRPHRAYRPDPAKVGTWRGTPQQAAQALRRLVEAAVDARTPSRGPVACHLTGGLDSSAIAVLAARGARQRSERILGLAICANSPMGPAEHDERPMVGAVLAQEPNIVHRVIDDQLPMPGKQEDPDWPGSAIGGPDDEMMAAAAAFGANRILSGVGGDEGATYNGANLYAALLRAGCFIPLFRELAARARSDGLSLPRTVRNRLISPLVPNFLRRRQAGAMDPRKGSVRYLAPSIRDRVAKRRMKTVLSRNDPAERVRVFADHHIPSRCTYYAFAAARHGLAVSFPLLDRRIVDFILSLPIQMFLADGQSRQPFRRAMRGILPEPVRLARHKVGLFDDRFIRYAEHRMELLAMIDGLRANAPSIVRELFDLDAIREGLECLPEPSVARSFVRTASGQLVGGHPAWVTVFAMQCLIAGWRLAHGSRGEGESRDPQ